MQQSWADDGLNADVQASLLFFFFFFFSFYLSSQKHRRLD